MHITLPAGARVDASFVSRVAGLPVAVLGRLRFEKSFALADRLVSDRAWLHTEGAALADLLHPVIGRANGEMKPALVGLRRALHRVRRPGSREWNEQVSAALPADIASRIQEWLSTMARCARADADLPGALATEWTAKEAQLRAVAGDPGFQRALLNASPALSTELTKWLGDERRRPRRQSVIRLAKYVARAAAKTSPFSTFTSSGLGTWSEDGPAVRLSDAAKVVGVAELNGGVLQGLIQVLRADPRLAKVLPLRVNPSVTVHDGHISFVGPPPREPLITVPATAAVLECLRVLGERAMPMADLVAQLTSDAAETARAEKFLDRLVAAGLLERQLPVADLAANPLDELADWLATTGDAAKLAEPVAKVRSLLTEVVPVAQVDGYRARLTGLHQAIGELTNQAGLAMAGYPEKFLVHDNAIAGGTMAVNGLSSWRPALSDLDIVRRWLAAFNMALPLRLVVSAFCVERFGPGCEVPLLMLHRAIHDERTQGDPANRAPAAAELCKLVGDTTLVSIPALGESRLPRLLELRQLRRDARDAMGAAPGADGVVRVDPSTVAEVVAGWPEWIRPIGSLGCYVQTIGDGADVRLALNIAMAGYGRGRSRVRHLVEQTGLGEPPPDGSWRAAGGGPALAELSGGFAGAANRRQPSVPYEIDYPFVVSGRPAAERIRLGDLVVVHDKDSELVKLVWRQHGVEVHPLHLGMMANVLLPPTARLVEFAFSGADYVHTSSLPPLAPPTEPAEPHAVVTAPRVEVGRVVLQRARWVVWAEGVPARGKGESDPEFYVRLLGWLREHGIPTRCFVHMRAGNAELSKNLLDWSSSKARKPVYVDFANAFLVSAFERSLTETGLLVIFEEALPEPVDAESNVTEFLVEISEPEDVHA